MDGSVCVKAIIFFLLIEKISSNLRDRREYALN